MTKKISGKHDKDVRNPKSGFEYHGWSVDTEDVRELADKMDVQEKMLLPEVIVAGKGSDRRILEFPHLFAVSRKEEPTGFLITIPERMVKEHSKTHYVLGHRAKENIRHELAHYLDHVERGTKTGRLKEPYDEAAKEIRADIRARRRSLPRCLAIVIRTLVRDYGLDDKEAFDVATRAANDLGVDSRTVNLAKKRYREGRI